MKDCLNEVEWRRQHDSIIRVGRDGTIKEDIIIKSDEEIVVTKKKRILSNKQKALLNNKNDLKVHNDSLGGFISMYYVKNELLFNHLELDRANISRLIYLSTYIDYNNRQENLLVRKGINNKVEPMTKEYLKDILGLSDKTFSTFFSQMKEKDLIFEANNRLYLSNDYFTKGKVDYKRKCYTRVYVTTTRILYENCSSRQHKQLSYAFQLIPKLHYETNIICENPDEYDTDNLIKLGLKDICEFLEISTERSNILKFEKNLYKLYITIEGKKYYLFKRVILKGHNDMRDYFVVNPNVIWKGNDFDRSRETVNGMIFGSK